MTSGIYGYWDNKKGYYAYIGKDSNIDVSHNRNYTHRAPSMYDSQPFNRVLQNNLDRYEYRILMEGDYNDKQLNKMERFCIKHLKTYYYDYPERSVFNFTIGGDGCSGYRHTEETKQKLSESHTGYEHTDEAKKKISESKKGKPRSEETVRKMIESKTLNYPRIIKDGKNKGKQTYCIKYNGKKLKTSFYIEKLEAWFKDNYPNEELIKGG